MGYFPKPDIAVPETAAEFRRIAPQFRDATVYTDEEIEFWLMAGRTFLTCRWGKMLGAGVILFAEHNLALGQYMANSAMGGLPGMGMRGMVTSESAGGVSISYDTGAATEPGAGHWNYTLFGQRFIRLARMMGAGPVQLNVPWSGGLCSSCGCYGMMDPLATGVGGRLTGVGPGWHGDSNVPVGKFLPPRPPNPMEFWVPRGFNLAGRPPVTENYTYSEGDVLENPDTGEKVQLRNNQWVFIP